MSAAACRPQILTPTGTSGDFLEFWLQALIALAIAWAFFSAFWILQKWLDNAAVVDVGWSLSVALMGVFFCSVGTGLPWRRGLAAILIVVWAVRLSWHLFLRWRGHPEDPRYTRLREEWGDRADWRMYRFYQMQALGAFLFALPLAVVAQVDSALGIADGLAIAIWVLAMVGEWLADDQLRRFKQDPQNAGQVCQQGLWRYSRHPNYFFEWLHWWTYVLLAWASPWVVLTLLAPLAMWFFLTRVTGVPTTEAQALRSRGEAYRRYQETTNAFFPWFPKTT